MIKLGLNIDHIATIRNARGENHPDIVYAAKFAKKCGADSITVHLREDRRHIKDIDLLRLVKLKKVPINLEISTNEKIVQIAIKKKPNFICLVPENRKEITTEGGLNLKKNYKKISKIIKKFNKKKIRTSLFINPNIEDIKLSKKIGTKCVEFHTGKLSTLIKKNKNYKNQLKKFSNCVNLANSLNLRVHAGHGMDYKTTRILSNLKYIEEFNIGHFLIGESIFDGLKKVVKKIKKLSK